MNGVSVSPRTLLLMFLLLLTLPTMSNYLFFRFFLMKNPINNLWHHRNNPLSLDKQHISIRQNMLNEAMATSKHSKQAMHSDSAMDQNTRKFHNFSKQVTCNHSGVNHIMPSNSINDIKMPKEIYEFEKNNWNLKCPLRNLSYVNSTGPYYRVALLSFPGSGNTWLRHLIQQLTGYMTASVYCDEDLSRKGFPGECTPINSTTRRCIVYKTHNFKGNLTELKIFDKAIILVRNPFYSLKSYYNYIKAYRAAHPKISTGNSTKLKDEKSQQENPKLKGKNQIFSKAATKANENKANNGKLANARIQHGQKMKKVLDKDQSVSLRKRNITNRKYQRNRRVTPKPSSMKIHDDINTGVQFQTSTKIKGNMRQLQHNIDEVSSLKYSKYDPHLVVKKDTSFNKSGPTQKTRLEIKETIGQERNPNNKKDQLKRNISNPHLAVVNEEFYNDSSWELHIRYQAKDWLKTLVAWLDHFEDRHLLVRYEDLQLDVLPSLKKISKFLNVQPSQKDFYCTYKNREGKAHRKQKQEKGIKDIFNDTMINRVNSVIMEVMKTTKRKHRVILKYLYID